MEADGGMLLCTAKVVSKKTGEREWDKDVDC